MPPLQLPLRIGSAARILQNIDTEPVEEEDVAEPRSCCMGGGNQRNLKAHQTRRTRESYKPGSAGSKSSVDAEEPEEE